MMEHGVIARNQPRPTGDYQSLADSAAELERAGRFVDAASAWGAAADAAALEVNQLYASHRRELCDRSVNRPVYAS